jgi:hypothetical protein
MIDAIADTEHLVLAEDMQVYVDRLRRRLPPALRAVPLGRIDRNPAWPMQALGREPSWYAAELDELRARLLDAVRYGQGCRDAAGERH